MSLIRVSIPLFLVLSLCVQTAFNTIVFIDFKVNQEEIAEMHCINKDKPEMQCDGKCYLKQQLEKVSEQDNEPPFSPRYVDAQLETLYIEFSDNQKEIAATEVIEKFYGQPSMESRPWLNSPFVPPQY